MSKEAPFEASKCMLYYVSPDTQRLTALEFTKTIREFVRFEWQGEFVDQVIQEISRKEVCAEKCLRLAITAFDHSLADDIRPYDGGDALWTDRAAVYYRSDAFKIDLPSALKTRLSNEIGGDVKETLFFYPEQSAASFLNGRVLRRLTPDILFWCSSEQNSANRPDPVCTATRQDVFISLIKCGINPLAEFVSEQEKYRSRILQSGLELQNKRVARRKSLLFVEADFEAVDKWKTNTCARWDRVLSCENSDSFEHGIALTGSGTSANEAAMLVARDLVGQGAVYKHPFWYYENEASVSRIFSIKTKSVKEADVLLVNLEPTNHFTLAAPNTETDPRETIDSFVQRAAALPNERHVLIVDVTVNPNIDIADVFGEELPHNLILLKTVSATKHQRGGRDNFFGVIGYSSAKEFFPLIKDLVEAHVDSVSGPLSGRSIANFPRPSHSWLVRKRFITANLCQSLAQVRPFPDFNRWSISPYSFHCFVFPPLVFVQKLAESNKGLCQDEVRGLMAGVNEGIFQAISRAVKLSGISEIQIGDSFGLPITRINTQGGDSVVNGVTYRLKIPRICPGYKSTHDQMRLLSGIVLDELDGYYSEFAGKIV